MARLRYPLRVGWGLITLLLDYHRLPFSGGIVVFCVRCFLCGANEVRLILGGREIIHARCKSCDTNLLAEVLALEAEAEEARNAARSIEERADGQPHVPSTTQDEVGDVKGAS